jgi:hypothetical protein
LRSIGLHTDFVFSIMRERFVPFESKIASTKTDTPVLPRI